jgi:hypothetical protein
MPAMIQLTPSAASPRLLRRYIMVALLSRPARWIHGSWARAIVDPGSWLLGETGRGESEAPPAERSLRSPGSAGTRDDDQQVQVIPFS